MNLRRLILMCGFALGVACMLCPNPTAGATASDAYDLGADALAVSRLINCTKEPAALAVSKGVHAGYCARLSGVSARFLKRFSQREKPLLTQVVPQDLDLPVVYPFGGGDLLTALGTYPNAKEITTLSLEVSGDVRAASRVKPEALEAALIQAGDNLRRLVAVEHSKTTNLSSMSHSPLPAEIVFSLYAISLWGFETTGFRYFDIAPDGSLDYWNKSDLDKREAEANAAAARGHLRSTFFPNIEVQFKRPGETTTRVFRHIAADLSDERLKKDSRVLLHLRAKQKVLAMTKAASYLLWWGTFSMIRQCLADTAVFMISDSTGFAPGYAKAQGFSQTTYGQFHGSFLHEANEYIAQSFIEMWRTQPQRPLPFRYGYPDRDGHGHMLVTKRETTKP
ncbi:MAG: hypothetical protein SF187_29460 [Deltaproteobacteria bacterium]|nr:hypothetical protein [Deltaproteobacteria bacterium]